MAGDSQSTVKIVNNHPSKFEVVKFDGTNNFDMWTCDVSIKPRKCSTFRRKPEETSEKNWDKMHKMMCGVIRSCLTQDIKYHVMVETSARKI